MKNTNKYNTPDPLEIIKKLKISDKKELEKYNKYMLKRENKTAGDLRDFWCQYKEDYKREMFNDFVKKYQIHSEDFYRCKFVCNYSGNPIFEEPLCIVFDKKSKNHSEDSSTFLDKNTEWLKKALK